MPDQTAITVSFAPVWDVRNDLVRLRGISGALAYLTGPAHLRADDEFEIFHESLMEIHERLDSACALLTEALDEMKFKKE